jgi:hypothetical protein
LAEHRREDLRIFIETCYKKIPGMSTKKEGYDGTPPLKAEATSELE